MSQYKFGLTPRAGAELGHASNWYEEQRKGLGTEFMLAVEAAFESVKRTPMLYPKIIGDARRVLVKRFPFGIIFELFDDTIVILSIFHLKRRPESFGRKI